VAGTGDGYFSFVKTLHIVGERGLKSPSSAHQFIRIFDFQICNCLKLLVD
jgi:hypothetical protein